MDRERQAKIEIVAYRPFKWARGRGNYIMRKPITDEELMKILEGLDRKELRAMLPVFRVAAESKRAEQKLYHMVRQWAWNHKETFFKITNNQKELRKFQRSLKTNQERRTLP